MNATQIENGTAVSLAETSRYGTTTRFGVVVESTEDRTRVKWSHLISGAGTRREDTKRTWIKTTRLTVIV